MVCSSKPHLLQHCFDFDRCAVLRLTDALDFGFGEERATICVEFGFLGRGGHAAPLAFAMAFLFRETLIEISSKVSRSM